MENGDDKYFVTYTASPKISLPEFTLSTLQYDLPVTTSVVSELPKPITNWRQAFDNLIETPSLETYSSNSSDTQSNYEYSKSENQYSGSIPESIKKVIDKAHEGKFYSTSSKKYESLGHNLYKGKCTSGPATFYRDALGIKLNEWWNTRNPGTATATNIGKYGFSKKWHGTAEDVKSGKLKSIVKPGDILVSYGTTRKGRNSAHAQMWDGEKWISDTVQDADFVYAKGRNGNESALLYRNDSLWLGNGGKLFKLNLLKNGGIIKAENGWATYTPIKKFFRNITEIATPTHLKGPYQPKEYPARVSNKTAFNNSLKVKYDFKPTPKYNPKNLITSKNSSSGSYRNSNTYAAPAPDNISEEMFLNLLDVEGRRRSNGKNEARTESKFKENFVTGPYGMVYKYDSEGNNKGGFKEGETMTEAQSLTNARNYYKYRANNWKEWLLGKPGLTQNRLDALVAQSGGTAKATERLKEFVVSNWGKWNDIANFMRKFAITSAGDGKVQPGLVLRRQMEADWFLGNRRSIDYYRNNRKLYGV